MRTLAVGILLSTLVLLIPVASATAPSSFLTTGLVASGAAQSTQGGVPGVAITYRNTYNASLSVFVYVDLTNSAGQTVYLNTNGLSLGANESATSFFGFIGLGHGTFTATLFATTGDGVPVSTPANVQVTL